MGAPMGAAPEGQWHAGDRDDPLRPWCYFLTVGYVIPSCSRYVLYRDGS